MMTSWISCAWRTAVLLLAAGSQPGLCLAAEPSGAEPSGDDRDGVAQPAAVHRVTHYAFLSTGPAFGERLGGLYWGVNNGMYDVLRQYGYPDESIYRFGDYEQAKPVGVDGKSTLSNFRRTFKHLQRHLKESDHLFIMVVGHGTFSKAHDDFVHPLLDGKLTATELKEMADLLPTKNVTVAMHPCYSGGFVPSLTGPGRVIVTSTNDREVNAVPWAEAFVESLRLSGGNDLNADGCISIKEAYQAALEPSRKRYGEDLKEHPLIDDNADGVGHFVGEEESVGGDGELASERFLGDGGMPLRFSADAIERLTELNKALRFDQ